MILFSFSGIAQQKAIGHEKGYLLFSPEPYFILGDIIFLHADKISSNYGFKALSRLKGNLLFGDASEILKQAKEISTKYKVEFRNNTLPIDEIGILPVEIDYEIYGDSRGGDNRYLDFIYESKAYSIKYFSNWDVHVIKIKYLNAKGKRIEIQ